MNLYFYIQPFKNIKDEYESLLEAHLSIEDEELGIDTVGLGCLVLPNTATKELLPYLNQAKNDALRDLENHLPKQTIQLYKEVFNEAL